MGNFKLKVFPTEMIKTFLSGKKTEFRTLICKQPPVLEKGREYFLCEACVVNADGALAYEADGEPVPAGIEKWDSAKEMPDEAARIRVRVTGWRTERLQSITVEGVLNEGFDTEIPPVCKKEFSPQERKQLDAMPEERREEYFKTLARHSYMGWCTYADRLFAIFQRYWDEVKAAESPDGRWDKNPYVMVISVTCDNINKKGEST